MLTAQISATRFLNRLRTLQRELPRAASAANVKLADTTLTVVKNAGIAEWSSRGDQVGFNADNWANLAGPVEIIHNHGLGILNVNRMGTADDFEKIKYVPQLWHRGRGGKASFDRLIMQKPGARERLAQERDAYWSPKEPQWWLLNYGNQMQGSFNPVPGTYTIERAAFDMAGAETRRIVEDVVNSRLRAAGVLI
jgi:hypothetical protein